MLKKFALWFICFVLSFLVSDKLGLTTQGKAFLYIRLSVSILIILAFIVILIIGGLISGSAAEANGISFLVVLAAAVALAITLFATWGATKLFGIDFFVAYQIMTFGQCLCTDSKKKDD